MRKLLVLLAVVAVSACDSRIGPSFVTPTSSIVGTFKLQTFNGQPLPAEISRNATTTVVVVADTFVFNSDKSLRHATGFTVTTPPAGPVPRQTEELGVYTSASGVVTVTLPNSDGLRTFTGTFAGATVTLTDSDGTWVYRK